MTSREKAIEKLLKGYKELLERYLQFLDVLIDKNDTSEAAKRKPKTIKDCKDTIGEIDQALALLKPAVCETCGDEAIKEAMEAVEQRKQGRYKLVYDKLSRTIVAVSNPNYLPGCKPAPTGQAEAGEFTKRLRKKNKVSIRGNLCVPVADLEEALAHIDRLEAELKQQYDKGFLEGTEAQDEANRKHIIEPLEAENKRLEEEARWIPVSERLPEKTEEDLRPQVLVFDGESVTGALWRHYSFGWDFETDRGKPTHWKPIILPEQALKEK